MSKSKTTATAPLEFKGRMMGISVLRVSSNDIDEIAAHLDQQVNKGGGLLRELPIVLDIDVQIIDLDALLGLLRKQHLSVLGMYRTAASMEAAARRIGLPVILERTPARSTPKPVRDQEEAPAAVAPQSAAPAASETPAAAQQAHAVETRLITTPVRSGQRIYARNSDLIITAQVSAGAEVIADGCIHVYGSLRGRAMAGAQGDEAARIFCRDLQAELLAIAGRYKVAEDISDDVRGKPVQIRLEGEKLCVDPLS
jgi:septum site-determining protein MinC